MCRNIKKNDSDLNVALAKYLVENGIDIKTPIASFEDAEHISMLMQQFISRRICSLLEVGHCSENEKEEAISSRKNKEVWGYCIKLMKCFINLLIDLCDKKKVVADEEHIKDFVLARLMGRGIRTYTEIVILLQNGFPYGAASLSRNLFEYMTIARFISGNDDCVALEYYRQTNTTPEQQKKDDYEWARKSEKFSSKENITFKKIQNAAGMADMEYYEIYSYLCKFSHASPQTVNYDMFAVTDDIYLGPSLYGVEIPGINSTLFLRDIFLSFCKQFSDTETLAKELLCAEFATYICNAFKEAADKCNIGFEMNRRRSSKR